ncbi:hypothetical protein KR059_010171, partial [Drosophila kikkawai]
QLTPCLLLVATIAGLGLQAEAIRVDWGTNTGPILPPPRTTPQPPRKPYREPAPVWEDLSDDVPNPNPYVYVLPPPSRPRYWAIPAGPYAPPNYNNLPPKQGNYGQLATSAYSGGVTSVPGLAAQYVPGVGTKYTAIVPDKLQGKYNAKTKKYKAYEKAKYAAYPWNYLQQLPLEEKALEWQAELEKRLDEEQARSQSQALSSSTTTSTTSSTSTTSTTTTTTTPAPSLDSSSSTSTAASTSTTSAASTSTSTTQQPTTIANYKLAHEKSAHLKKLGKQKRLQQLHLEQEKLQMRKKMLQQQEQNSLSS